MHSWLKLATVAMLCISLFGAPCRNCQPKETKAHCGHDCCPKPKPAPGCAWQPSDTASTDAQAAVELAPPEQTQSELASTPLAMEREYSPEVRVDWSPPPLFLSHSAFLI